MSTSTAHRGADRGVFPVVPTIFDESGALDLEGQLRAIDFMIDAGSEGLCILANFSEQFVLTDAARDQVMSDPTPEGSKPCPNLPPTGASSRWCPPSSTSPVRS